MSTYQYPDFDKIDWSDHKSKISEYFTVGEATYLPSWKIHHLPSLSEKQNIVDLAKRMDAVRRFINHPIRVSCWIRPTKVNAPGSEHHGKDYNALVNGAKASAHIVGKGIDWIAPKRRCDEIRALLVPKLEEFGLRCEDLPGSNWIHCDTKAPFNNNRYFKP